MSVQGATWLKEFKQRLWGTLSLRRLTATVDEQETIDRLLEHDALAHQPLTPWLLYAASTAKRGWMRLDERLLVGEIQHRVPANVQAVLHVLRGVLTAEWRAMVESCPTWQLLTPCFEPAGDGISISCPNVQFGVSSGEPALHVLFLEQMFYLGGRDEQFPHTLLLLTAPDARTYAHLCAKLRWSLSDDRVREAIVRRVSAAQLAAAWERFETRTVHYDLMSSPDASR